MLPFEELDAIAKKVASAADPINEAAITTPLKRLVEAADQVGLSFSGSWLGYHSRVYYAGLAPRPPGANFSQEWGLKDLSFTRLGSVGDWQEFDPESVKQIIRSQAGDPDLESARDAAKNASEIFEQEKANTLSILETELSDNPDTFLAKLKERIEGLEPLSTIDVAQIWSPKGQIMTRDTLALGQGTQIPPHIEISAEVQSIRHSFGICKTLAAECTKAASHLERKSRKAVRTARIGTNVFIGHGRSSSWRELKDFIQDRLSLPFDEFNRVPVAGVTNIARLSEMLDAAAIAFLVMTAEDEMVDGEMQARMNVVHEAGLFQGRLGFTKAIVLLEDGCNEFSNIQGLGQIRFPKDNISASFEEIRRVLEREEVIPSHKFS